MTPLLRGHQPEQSFGGVAALDGCSLAIQKGSVTGLIGPNGAGKTTLLNLITGLVRPDAGSVIFDGHDIAALPMHRIASLGLVRTFQIVRELGGLTVLENLLLAPPQQRGETIAGTLFAHAAVREQEQRNAVRARATLQRVGLWKLADQSASALVRRPEETARTRARAAARADVGAARRACRRRGAAVAEGHHPF